MNLIANRLLVDVLTIFLTVFLVVSGSVFLSIMGVIYVFRKNHRLDKGEKKFRA